MATLQADIGDQAAIEIALASMKWVFLARRTFDDDDADRAIATTISAKETA